MGKKVNRRQFIQNSTMAGIGVLATSGMPAEKSKDKKKTTLFKSKINIGIIGTGLRGQNHLDLLLDRTDCEVPFICDIDQRMLTSALNLYDKKGKPRPKVFSEDEQAYLKMLNESTLDAVIIATPWRWHTEMAVAAMEAGKYTGMEVCGGFSVDECWQLVNTSERTRVPLFFLENVCYRRDVMAVLNIVREGLFGELIHLEGGYQHDLRGVKFNDGITPYNSGVEFGAKGFSEAKWRTQHSIHRNGDLYPTHGVGPVAQYININRGNRFLYLTAVASKARGLHNYIVDHPKGGAAHPNASVGFQLGDKVTTSIKCSNGETIVLHHDTSLPRPYSLGFRVQGTKGIWMDVNKSIHLEGHSLAHRWEAAEPWLKKYDHPLWKKYESQATGAGHGGMDFFLDHAFVECAKRNETPPFDVYDAAAWLVITPLSEQSIAMGSQPMPFPDFTRGRWINQQPNFALGDNY